MVFIGHTSEIFLLQLTVAPTDIEMITGREGSQQIDINENEEFELECIVKDAKPEAQIVWFKNSSRFSGGEKLMLHGTNRDISQYEVVSDSREDSVQDGSLSGRKTAKSKIKFRPTRWDDGANIACEARHPATRKNMRVSVTLSVLCKYTVVKERCAVRIEQVYSTMFYSTCSNACEYRSRVV